MLELRVDWMESFTSINQFSFFIGTSVGSNWINFTHSDSRFLVITGTCEMIFIQIAVRFHLRNNDETTTTNSITTTSTGNTPANNNV